MPNDVARQRAQVEVDGDAGIENDAIEHAGERFRRRIEAVAVGTHRAGADVSQASRASGEIVQRFGIGGRGIGVIDPLHDLPGRARRTACDWGRFARARMKRLDRDPVIGLGDKSFLEARAL